MYIPTMMKLLRNITVLIFLTILPLAAYAVTDKEMEEARVIAAKLYLRWSNDASGYLDDVNATSMSDLQSKLKAKEKENLKAFNSVRTPADYKSWDKQKFVEYWGKTFFTSPGLSADGKRAKDRVRKQVEKIKVSAPVKEEPKNAPTALPAQEAPAAEAPGEAQPESGPEALPSAEVAVEEQERILADQNAIEQDREEAVASTPRNSGTWIYVVILIVLVAIVIGLMVFAARIMKKQPESKEGGEMPDSHSADELRRDFSKAMQKKNDELRDVTDKLTASEESNSRLKVEIASLRKEINRLESELSSAREESAVLRSNAASRQAAPEITETAAPRQTVAERPLRQEAEPAKVLNTIYLGRANGRGLFVRGDRRPSPGNTIYRLDTRDGLVGTFRIADDAAAVDLAFSDPATFLAGGCTGNFEDAATAERIVTENSGTAIFEGNCWKVLRKSRIRFE